MTPIATLTGLNATGDAITGPVAMSSIMPNLIV